MVSLVASYEFFGRPGEKSCRSKANERVFSNCVSFAGSSQDKPIAPHEADERRKFPGLSTDQNSGRTTWKTSSFPHALPSHHHSLFPSLNTETSHQSPFATCFSPLHKSPPCLAKCDQNNNHPFQNISHSSHTDSMIPSSPLHAHNVLPSSHTRTEVLFIRHSLRHFPPAYP